MSSERTASFRLKGKDSGADTRRLIHVVFYSQAQTFAGGEQVLSHLLNGLSLSRFKLTCICTSRETMRDLQLRQSRPEVDFILFDSGDRPSLWRTVLLLARLLRRLRPDVVHCNSIDQYAGSYAIFASKLARVSVVVGTVHTAGPHPRQSWADKLFAWSADHLLKGVILVSEYCQIPVLRDRYLAPDKISVIKNGIALPPPQCEDKVRPSAAPTEVIRIGSAGKLIPRKSFSTLIKAMSCLHDTKVTSKLTIIGDGPERNYLEQLAQERNLDGRIDFAGWQDDMYAALSLLDIFVLPSLNESAGLVLLEAMASGLPVIATNVGGIPEYVADGETGLLVPPRDPVALAQALKTLIDDLEKRRAMGRAGRQRVEAHFTAERMVAETAALYERLLDG